jgi:hypothetical protein
VPHAGAPRRLNHPQLAARLIGQVSGEEEHRRYTRQRRVESVAGRHVETNTLDLWQGRRASVIARPHPRAHRRQFLEKLPTYGSAGASHENHTDPLCVSARTPRASWPLALRRLGAPTLIRLPEHPLRVFHVIRTFC